MLDNAATVTDWFEAGVGAGLFGWDWIKTVGGNFLLPWQRKALAQGWRQGQTEWRTAGYEAAPLPTADEVPL